jgi:hypothetical protein
MFVNFRYFYAKENLLLELRDEKWGGGSLGLFSCLILSGIPTSSPPPTGGTDEEKRN